MTCISLLLLDVFCRHACSIKRYLCLGGPGWSWLVLDRPAWAWMVVCAGFISQQFYVTILYDIVWYFSTRLYFMMYDKCIRVRGRRRRAFSSWREIGQFYTFSYFMLILVAFILTCNLCDPNIFIPWFYDDDDDFLHIVLKNDNKSLRLRF